MRCYLCLCFWGNINSLCARRIQYSLVCMPRMLQISFYQLLFNNTIHAVVAGVYT